LTYKFPAFATAK